MGQAVPGVVMRVRLCFFSRFALQIETSQARATENVNEPFTPFVPLRGRSA